MSCQCHQIGGPFIAEDPDCPAHGREAQRADEVRDSIIRDLRESIEGASVDTAELLCAAERVLAYLESL